jgi:hypothetical protein
MKSIPKPAPRNTSEGVGAENAFLKPFSFIHEVR